MISADCGGYGDRQCADPADIRYCLVMTIEFVSLAYEQMYLRLGMGASHPDIPKDGVCAHILLRFVSVAVQSGETGRAMPKSPNKGGLRNILLQLTSALTLCARESGSI